MAATRWRKNTHYENAKSAPPMFCRTALRTHSASPHTCCSAAFGSNLLARRRMACRLTMKRRCLARRSSLCALRTFVRSAPVCEGISTHKWRPALRNSCQKLAMTITGCNFEYAQHNFHTIEQTEFVESNRHEITSEHIADGRLFKLDWLCARKSANRSYSAAAACECLQITTQRCIILLFNVHRANSFFRLGAAYWWLIFAYVLFRLMKRLMIIGSSFCFLELFLLQFFLIKLSCWQFCFMRSVLKKCVNIVFLHMQFSCGQQAPPLLPTDVSTSLSSIFYMIR